jgi:hypothetical protein
MTTGVMGEDERKVCGWLKKRENVVRRTMEGERTRATKVGSTSKATFKTIMKTISGGLGGFLSL